MRMGTDLIIKLLLQRNLYILVGFIDDRLSFLPVIIAQTKCQAIQVYRASPAVSLSISRFPDALLVSDPDSHRPS